MKNKYLSFLILFFAILNANSAFSQKAKPIIKNGLAQPVEEFSKPEEWIRHDLWVETEFDTDGDSKADRMHVSVTRQKQTETEGLKLPVIYVSSPYFAGVSEDDNFWDVRHELGETPPERVKAGPVKRTGERPIISNTHIDTWLPLGFIVVHSSSPGTGLSDGSPTVGGKNESLAPKAVIDWLNGRAKGYTSREGNEEVFAYWSTGKVGMTGTSYNGTIPLAAATTGVEGLEAIIPIAPNTSYYHYYRSNGLVRSPGGYLGEDIDVLYEFIHSGEESKRAYADSVVRDKLYAKGMDRLSGDYNDFWASRDYLNQMENMKAALFMSHGFNDWNVMPEHSYRIYNKAREMGLDAKIYYHQFGHGGPPPIDMMNAWFTKYLYDVDNGAEKGAKAWIVREGDKMNEPTAYEDYPNPKADMVKLFPGEGAPKRGKLSLNKAEKNITESLVDNYSFSGSALAKAEQTNHRLIYTTPVLKEDLHLSGISKLKIRLSSSKKAANLSVWLVSLPWNEGRRVKYTDNIITRGWADPQNHRSLRKSKELKEGKFYELRFDLQPDDQVIKAGQQIGLMIFSSDREYTLWPEPGTVLTVDLSNTSIELPIVGGVEAYKKSVE